MNSVASAAPPGLTPEVIATYNELVTGVKPVGIRLISVRLSATSFLPGGAEASVTELSARWEARTGGFSAIQPFKVEGSSAEGARFSLELELAVDYESSVAMTNELFEVFGQVNLPLNAHPFVREAVASLTMRAGWPPLILPAFVKAGRKT